MLLRERPEIEDEAAVVGAGFWISLYACGRVKVREYSPVRLGMLSSGSCLFFTIFRIGILSCLLKFQRMRSKTHMKAHERFSFFVTEGSKVFLHVDEMVLHRKICRE